LINFVHQYYFTKMLDYRIVENNDWVFVLFFVVSGLVVFIRNTDSNRYIDFTNILFSDKYFNIYREIKQSTSAFSLILFLIKSISYAFFILLVMDAFGFGSKNDWILFVQIMILFVFFISAKYIIEKIVAIAFAIENEVEQFGVYKVTYRKFLGLLLLPINLVLFCNEMPQVVYLVLILIIIVLTVATYVLAIKKYQNIIIDKLFYFILYLCTFEIAPYFFIYHFYIKERI
jgi:hypothetical protein